MKCPTVCISWEQKLEQLLFPMFPGNLNTAVSILKVKDATSDVLFSI